MLAAMESAWPSYVLKILGAMATKGGTMCYIIETPTDHFW